ncbi:MAG: DUF72 domain-containing protein [Thermoplasmata archaeon]|nr:DUF72 domain-containing protein [Thermoplasmata archaeon]
MGDIRLGTSGWDYEEWIGPFYQRRSASKLQAYAAVFDTAEINSTFYRVPSPGMVMGWTTRSPENMSFSAKVPQTVTHDRLLRVEKGAGRELQDYCDLMRPLLEAGKLGVLLLQLPPRLRFHEDRTRAFFEALPDPFPFAIEFRNASWMVPAAFELLREFGVAYTVVDEPLLPPEVHVTASIAYFRWHGHGRDPWYNYRYRPEELEPWIPRLQETAPTVDTLYGYFNNHFHGNAPENALEVLEMLGVLTPEQQRTLRRIRDFRRGVLRARHGRVKTTKLDDFGGEPEEPEEPTPRDLLVGLTSNPRLERAEGLVDAVRREGGDDLIQAKVNEYTVTVDPARRVVRHDCADWRKNIPTGPLCKHVSAVFLALPREEAVSVLADLKLFTEKWRREEIPTR